MSWRLLLLRVRWRRALIQSWTIVLLIGVIGGFVLASAAAARRVGTAYSTLLVEIGAPDFSVAPANDCGATTGIGCQRPGTEMTDEEIVERLTNSSAIEKVRLASTIRPYLVDELGRPLLGTPDNVTGCYDGDRSVYLVALSPGGSTDQPLPFRLDGQLPTGGASGIVLSRGTAERVGLGVGGDVHIAGWCSPDGDPVRLGAVRTIPITGLAVGPLDVEPPGVGITIEPAYLSANEFDAIIEKGAQAETHTSVWLHPMASPDEVVDALADFQVNADFGERERILQKALSTDTNLLWVLAVIGAIGGMLVLAPVISRNQSEAGPDVATLAAMGAQRRQLSEEAVTHAVALAVGGAAVAVCLSIPFSAWMPRGFSAAIVSGREFRADGLVTSIGVAGVIALVFTIGRLAAFGQFAHDSSREGDVREGSARLQRLRPAARTGVLAAIGIPAGPRRGSPWPSLLSMMVVLATGVASLTYLAGLRHLERTPAVVGWNWDALVSFEFGQATGRDVPAIVAAIDEVEGVEVTAGTGFPPWFLLVPNADYLIWPWSFATGPGAITPTMLDGRAPDGPDEVAIDPLLADQLGLGIGDVVTLSRASLLTRLFEEMQQNSEQSSIPYVLDPPSTQDSVASEFEITGIAVLPLERSQAIPQVSLTLAGFVALGQAGEAELLAAQQWLPHDLPPSMAIYAEEFFANLDFSNHAFYLRFAGDFQQTVTAVAAVRGVTEVVAPTSDEVLRVLVGLNVDRNDRVPLALFAITGVAMLALLSYLLAFAVRSRRFELAIMRALGLATKGLRRSLMAQATATAVIVLAVGVPAGVVVGRWAWLGYAHDFDVLPVAVVPWATLSLIALGVIVVSNLAVLLPGWFETRRSPAPDLSAE